MKTLPARPSLDSLRKQAKKLARDIAAGNAEAIARARAHLPRVDVPLTQRNAQLVVAREYGFAGWQELLAEVSKRTGNDLEWAAAHAKRAIHDNDLDRLKQLLAEYPALESWRGGDETEGLVGFATDAFGDAFGEERERWFTRAAAAELLIDAGAVVTPSVVENLIFSRAVGLLHLFQRKGLLPRTLKFDAALGDLGAVRAALDRNANDLPTINEAFLTACRFEHEALASLLLERSTALDPELGARIDGTVGRFAFVKSLLEREMLDPTRAAAVGLWKTFVIGRIQRARLDGNLKAFVEEIEREPWLMGEDFVWLQVELIENATVNGREELITALLDSSPALLERQPPPPTQAFEHALTYAHTHLVPLLARIWPLPDDLPHAAGMGNLTRVKQWFDESGAPALGDLDHHFPCNSPRARGHLTWGPPAEQQVLDTALAFAVINRHFDVADFLLEHGADIDTNWNSHEPASILHHLVFLPDNYESMRFLVDRGIDLGIKDYRWDSTAWGWAFYALKDEQMARWLEEAERQRAQGMGGQR